MQLPTETQSQEIWRQGQGDGQGLGTGSAIYRPDLFATIESTIDLLNDDLCRLSVDLLDHPELKFEEHHAHDILTDFLSKQGFEVTRHHHLDTAWEAKFTHGSGGRTVGVNSEMDALPGVGHACGHNLIAIAGLAVACAVKAVLVKHDISGSVILLGTPAEEGGYGKLTLLEKGAYKDMDVCLMCHPAPGPPSSASLSSSLALSRVNAEYFGHTAHAALSPWEGVNALDAAVSAYTNISLLRQQLNPSHRVHGIIEGRDWAPNIIPDYAKMIWYVRARTQAEVDVAVPRVTNCMSAASLATGCKVDVKIVGGCSDLRQNKALGEGFASVFRSKYGSIDYEWGIKDASTDFGNVTYALPSIHPGFAIPTVKDGGNHTRAFADAARLPVSHKACFNVSKALAAVGVRVLTDDEFFEEVKNTFEEDKRMRAVA